MNFWLTIIVVVVLMGLVFLGLAIQVIFKKSHEFPNTHIGGNEHLKKRGVTCATTWDKMEQKKVKKSFTFKEVKLLDKA